ncbi:zinc finger matrin-type protein 5 [Drosophila rhopaloa]|uniref:C3H1-type domain-containing protein n=1 Tax=Drosophila rhopaloa TaxID=1041015 RepID=A0ABM5GZ66_DRORH|nr:zinc finger matrin-type protein 5 [Drosophila rhopaloa]
MGGKSYFCDYCCCFMKNDLNVRKLHNDGISHTIAKTNYMRRYDDPKKILTEERRKIPCNRYLAGYCKFDLFCKYCHYSEKELKELEKIVLTKKKSRSRKRGKSNQWPWKTHSQTGLPPSLQNINLAKLRETNFELNWG